MTTNITRWVSPRLRWIVALEFKAQDCWIGWYWEVRQAEDGPGSILHVWVCLLPMLPLHVVRFR